MKLDEGIQQVFCLSLKVYSLTPRSLMSIHWVSPVLFSTYARRCQDRSVSSIPYQRSQRFCPSQRWQSAAQILLYLVGVLVLPQGRLCGLSVTHSYLSARVLASLQVALTVPAVSQDGLLHDRAENLDTF